MSTTTGAPRFEAALNLLREQRRAVEETRRQVMADDDLRLTEPRHRQLLLDQMLAEIAQLSEAVSVLERLQDGLAAYASAPAGPRVAAALQAEPERVTGLMRRVDQVPLGRLA